MKPRTLIPLVLGVVVGAIAIKIVVDVVSKAQAAPRADVVPCVVAKTDIEFAEEITIENLVVSEWPKSSLPPEYFSSIEELAGRVSDMFIPKDVPVYPSMLAPEGTPPGIQVRIKKGYRAVAVAIDEVTGVSYQVKPGDHVDIVAMVKQKTREGVQQVSRIILKNVEVATVGRTLNSSKPGDKGKSTARSITLLLKPEEVTELHLAQSMGGRLALALRGNTDNEEDPTAVADADPEPEPEPEPEPVAAPPVQPVQRWSVNVISGTQIQNVQYRWMDGRWEPEFGASNGPSEARDSAPFMRPRGLQENADPQDFDADSDRFSTEDS